MSPPRRPASCARSWPAARRRPCARRTRCPPRTTSRPRSPETGIEVRARRGEDADAYAAHVAALAAARPQITIDDGADLISAIHAAGGAALDELHGRDGGDDDGPAPRAPAGGRRQARLPGARGQRGALRARLQRPPRHGPVRARRNPAGDQPAARRPDGRRGGLRLDRAGHRTARAGRRCRRGGVRGRPDVGARGAHGRLRGDAGARRGRARRRVHHGHGLALASCGASTSSA